MSVFPKKSLYMYHFTRSAKIFWPYPPPRIRLPPLGNGLGGGKNLGGRDEKYFSIFGWKGCILTSLSCRESKSVTKKIVDI